ncbi:hypothetical protein BsWGS_08228 [Bradybaena similaris]
MSRCEIERMTTGSAGECVSLCTITVPGICGTTSPGTYATTGSETHAYTGTGIRAATDPGIPQARWKLEKRHSSKLHYSNSKSTDLFCCMHFFAAYTYFSD